MELSLGNRIAQLRKAKGMTQAQLAGALGISPPAVSKWETDSSCPDITMLCPLARALGTNVDTLLEYEESLPEEKAAEYAGNIIALKREQGVKRAEEELEKLLHRYPNSIPLKFQAAALFSIFEMEDPEADGGVGEKRERQRKKLLEEIYRSKDPVHRPAVISALASLALSDNDPDKAEDLLKELPESPEDATPLWVQLYLERGESKEAVRTLQKRMFTLASRMLSCLVLMIEKFQQDEERIMSLCSTYRLLNEIVYAGAGESDLVYAKVYGDLGQEQKAAEHLISYLESHAEKLPRPNPVLFDSIFKPGTEGRPAMEIKEMLLRGIKSDPVLAKLCERRDVKSVIKAWEC